LLIFVPVYSAETCTVLYCTVYCAVRWHLCVVCCPLFITGICVFVLCCDVLHYTALRCNVVLGSACTMLCYIARTYVLWTVLYSQSRTVLLYTILSDVIFDSRSLTFIFTFFVSYSHMLLCLLNSTTHFSCILLLRLRHDPSRLPSLCSSYA
jgi:hypothetical protein